MLIISCKNDNREQSNSQVETRNMLGNFDISKNDSIIIFSMYTKNGSSIYQMNIDGTEQKKIINSNKDFSFFLPKFSKDGKKIVFNKCYRKNALISEICIANSDGSEIEQLTNMKENITDAIFSSYSNEIFFFKATEYSNYSPLAPKQAHGFDIYSLDLETKEVKKISKLNAYGLYYLSEYDSTKLLITIKGGYDGGIFLCQKEPFKLLKRIIPKNNPINDPSSYYAVAYSAIFNIMVFITPYQLYSMKMSDSIATLLYNKDQPVYVESICLFNSQPRVLFQKRDVLSLYSINIEGTGLAEIPIIIDK